ncbi:MAG TPA: tetratricopeptide repeat protein [Candidatus Polarisedimenticolaceae bacterium]
MKIRTLLLILLAMGAVHVMATLFVANRELLEREFHFGGGYDLKVGLTLLLFLVAGVLFATGAGLTREASKLMDGWKRRKEDRRSERIEEEYSKGLAAVLEGRDDEAMRRFRAALEWDSRHFNTLLKLGEVLRAQERFDEAIELHRKAHHLKEDDPRPLYALVEDYEAKDDLDRARAVLGRILALRKDSVSAWRKLRSLHMKERDWPRALEAHLRVEKYAIPGDARDAADRRFGVGIRYEIASSMLAAGKAKDSTGALRKLLKDEGHFVPAHVRLGEALLEQGAESEAVEAWHHGFEETGSPVFLTILEDHYLGTERPLQAIEALKRCVARARKDTVARFYLGKLYFRLEMLDDAMVVLSSLEGRASYAPTLHFLLGRIHERRKQWREASSEYRKVIKEMDLVQLEYRCRHCAHAASEWNDRCESCGEWNCVEVNFREEISPEDLGLSRAPVYTARV